MEAYAIVCDGVSKRFRRYSGSRPRRIKDLVFGGWRKLLPEETRLALDDVSFCIRPERALGVIGRNGAGKSTLLRLVGGVGEPDQGRILVNGRIGGLLDLQLGFHPDLTGRENLVIGGIMGGLSRHKILDRMEAIASFAELEDFLDEPLRTYSSGMRMRLGFSIAAHSDPDVLLIDEVLSVGDMSFQRKCKERIAEYKAQGTAVLLVSHNPSEVEELCEQVLWLEHGRVRALGDSRVVLEEYRSSVSGVATTGARHPQVATASTGQPLRMHENRTGTLQLEMEKVRVTDTRERDIRVLGSGCPLQVHIDFVPREPVAHPIFQVKVVREDGFVCWEGNTLAAGVQMPVIERAGSIRLTIERQDLSEGKYFVEVGAYQEGWRSVYDYHFRVYALEIDASHYGEGVLDLPSHWELASEFADPVARGDVMGAAGH